MKPEYLSIAIAISGIGFLFDKVLSFRTGTTDFGQATTLEKLDRTHYSITTCALYRLAMTYLKRVNNVTYLEPNVKVDDGSCRDLHTIIVTELARHNHSQLAYRQARQEIAMANILADLYYDYVPYAHFDDEQFENGSIFIMMQLNAARSSLARQEWIQARMAIGTVLHAVQDFYSHTNWIELGFNVPNQDLATGHNLGSVAAKNARTCIICNATNKNCLRNNLVDVRQLTSGYFSYISPEHKPIGKCSHGGSADLTAGEDSYGGGISKDGTDYDHGHLHYQAASVAYDASVKVLDEFWTSTSNDAFGKFLGLSNSFSVVFVIDVSSRMQQTIDMVRNISAQLAATVEDLLVKPSNYILIPFNNSNWGPIHTETDPFAFSSLIQTLNENYLQNPSQHYYDGLNEALKVCESNSLMFLFTDAPAHDFSLQGLTLALSQLKQTKIDVLLIESTRSRSETIKEIAHIAMTTGGLVINVNFDQPETIQELVFRRLDEFVDYECALFEPMANRRGGIFMIDATATSIRIKVVSSSRRFTVDLINPTNSLLQLISSSNSDYLHLYTIDISNESDIGQWTYGCSEACAIEVNVRSKFRCRTRLYAPVSHGLFAVIATPPLVGESSVYAITTCDDSNKVVNNSIQLVDTNGDILTNYSTVTTDLVTTIVIPAQSFRIRTSIGLEDGTLIYREEPFVIDTSQILMAIYNQPLIVFNNQSLDVHFRIRNDAEMPLYVQLHIKDVLTTSRWYYIDQESTSDDFITLDATQYQLMNETVRLVLLVYSLQAFKDNNTIQSDGVLFHHEQIVPLYVLSTPIRLEPPTQFVDTATSANDNGDSF